MKASTSSFRTVLILLKLLFRLARFLLALLLSFFPLLLGVGILLRLILGEELPAAMTAVVLGEAVQDLADGDTISASVTSSIPKRFTMWRLLRGRVGVRRSPPSSSASSPSRSRFSVSGGGISSSSSSSSASLPDPSSAGMSDPLEGDSPLGISGISLQRTADDDLDGDTMAASWTSSMPKRATTCFVLLGLDGVVEASCCWWWATSSVSRVRNSSRSSWSLSPS